jgi:hypothetical protein
MKLLLSLILGITITAAGVVAWRSGALSSYLHSLQKGDQGGQTASRTGNITSDCHMIYETPGNPANAIELVFKLGSKCDYGGGEQNCLSTEGDFYCGQNVRLDGENLETDSDGVQKVAVKTLTAVAPADSLDICCTPQGEKDPDYKGFVSYRNPKFNYQIQWSQEWHKQGDNEPPYPPPPYTMNFSRRFSLNENPPEICDFEIFASEDANAFNGEIKDEISEAGIEHNAAYTFGVDGITGDLFTQDTDFQKVISIYFRHSTFSFRMGYNLTKTDQTLRECVPTFDKMIQSFQFLD